MKISFIYATQNTYKGTLYLHGYRIGQDVPVYQQEWVNGNLGKFDEALPNLIPGMLLSCEVEFISKNDIFTSYYILGNLKIETGIK